MARACPPLAGRNVGELIELAPAVRPAERFRDGPRRAAGLVEPPVAGIGVSLQYACERPKVLDRMAGAGRNGIASAGNGCKPWWTDTGPNRGSDTRGRDSGSTSNTRGRSRTV